MKAIINYVSIVTAVGFLLSLNFTTTAYADIEAVSVFATHIAIESNQLEASQEQVSNEVATEYAAEILTELDERLPTQFKNLEATQQ